MPPLERITVLDRGDETGAVVAALLADLGATVQRDRPIGDDVDVLLVTGAPTALRNQECDPVTLCRQHPRLIVVALTPFGLDGPCAEWRSCDTIAQAAGGMLFVNGHADEPPLRVLGTPTYFGAGLHAAIGVVLALLDRDAHGGGQIVDVSLQESATAMLEHVTGLFRDRGVIARRQGTLHWSGMFRVIYAADGPVLVSHAGDWTALLEWMASERAAVELRDPRWQSPDARAAGCEQVFAVMAAWARRHRAADLVEQAQRRRLPFSPVLPLRAAAHHPQLHARGFLAGGDPPRIIRPFHAAFAGAAPTSAPQRVNAPTRPGVEQTGQSAHPVARPSARAPILSGIRVLDFTWVVAGPLATRVLADHGAEVIKVERLDTPADAQARSGARYGNLNRGKRSVAVDLTTERGRELVRALALRCDVMVDNFSPRVLAQWGLDYLSLAGAAPQLIGVSLSAFGATGPLRDAVAYGPGLQAQLGFTWHMRHPDSAPAGCGFAFADTASGYAAALAIVAAVRERRATGRGRWLDLSQLELVAMALEPLLARALGGAVLPDAFGNAAANPDVIPHGVYRCRDDDGRERWCAITVADDVAWERFAAAAGQAEWQRDPRLKSASGRRTHAAALDRSIGMWTSVRAAEEIVATLQAAGVAAAVVADARDLAGDPQLAARGYWIEAPGGAVLDGIVPRLSATPGRVTAPGPRLGADTDAVLRDLLGMEQSALARLRAEGVIR